MQRDAGEAGRKVYSESSGPWRSEEEQKKSLELKSRKLLVWGLWLKLPEVNESGSYELVHQ